MSFFKILAVGILLTTINVSSFSQDTFYLPEGFQTYKDDDGTEVRCDGDFDYDGKKDLAILCVNGDESQAIVVVYLTTRYFQNGTYSWFPWDLDMYHTFVYENDVLTISQMMGFGSNFTLTMKFKYYDNLNNMRLVNYYSEVDYTVIQDINLITGNYVVDGKKGKSNFDLITLSNIEKHLDYLRSFSAK
jgi:hypothetical protein